jgi:hypothetical protein
MAEDEIRDDAESTQGDDETTVVPPTPPVDGDEAVGTETVGEDEEDEEEGEEGAA